jgi:ElaB/YqjD/DUF883 family membrane-anchored ribosome-binding protein
MDERPDVEERSSDEIERDIAATRESITQTVEQIGDRLHQAVDWRSYLERHPWAALAAAAGLGLMLGRLAANRFAADRPPRIRY